MRRLAPTALALVALLADDPASAQPSPAFARLVQALRAVGELGVHRVALVSGRTARELPAERIIELQRQGHPDMEIQVLLKCDRTTIVNRMADEVKKALAAPEVLERLAKMGASASGLDPVATAAFHRRELAKFKRAVELSGAKEE